MRYFLASAYVLEHVTRFFNHLETITPSVPSLCKTSNNSRKKSTCIAKHVISMYVLYSKSCKTIYNEYYLNIIKPELKMRRRIVYFIPWKFPLRFITFYLRRYIHFLYNADIKSNILNLFEIWSLLISHGEETWTI